MAHDSTPHLADPVLRSPRHEQRVPAAAVMLFWEPSDGAEGYTVEVAIDTTFHNVVLDTPVGTATEYRLDGVLPPDQQTYYWRVLATAGGRESPGEHVESFITLNDGDLGKAPSAAPDEDEDSGPGAELFRVAGKDAAAEAGSKTAGQASANEGVEREGVASAQILGMALAIIFAIGFAIVLMFQWKSLVFSRIQIDAVANPPGYQGGSDQVARYPVLFETEAAAAQALDQYEVLNDAEGQYRIPIDQAIRLLSNEQQARADSAGGAQELPDLSPR